MNKDKIVEILIQKGQDLFSQPYKKIEFTKNPEADDLLNNLKAYPHAFVLACIMDRQMKAEKAWLIPYKVYREIGDFTFSTLFSNLDKIKEFFKREKPTRFYKIMVKDFCSAIQRVQNDYNGDASRIWQENPTSGTVVRRFLEFGGVGPKIATMAANILVRDFKIPMKDHNCIDISPDVHVKRVFKRLGLIKNASNDEFELMYCARELNPEYPGIFDLPTWEIGRNRCHPKIPDCKNCYLNKYCPKIIKG